MCTPQTLRATPVPPRPPQVAARPGLSRFSDDAPLPKADPQQTLPSRLVPSPQPITVAQSLPISAGDSALKSRRGIPDAPLMIGSLPPVWVLEDMPALALPPSAGSPSDDGAIPGLGSLSASYLQRQQGYLSVYAMSCPAAVWGDGGGGGDAPQVEVGGIGGGKSLRRASRLDSLAEEPTSRHNIDEFEEHEYDERTHDESESERVNLNLKCDNQKSEASEAKQFVKLSGLKPAANAAMATPQAAPAAPAAWRLKVKCAQPLPVGQHEFADVDPAMTLAQLKERLRSELGSDISVVELVLRFGFPPRSLSEEEEATTLVSGVLANNEAITLTHIEASGGIVQGKSPMKRPKTIEEMSVSLAAAAGGAVDIASKAFRAALRVGVASKYEESQAEARVRAAMGGLFKIEEAQGERVLGTGAATKLRVSYSKGLNARSNSVDEVEVIDAAQLAAVLAPMTSTEDERNMLRPASLARASPRVFWNLVRLFGGDIEAALRQAVPQADWSYLRARPRQLSAKALANQEQRQPAKRQRRAAAAAADGGTGEPVDAEGAAAAGAAAAAAAEEQGAGGEPAAALPAAPAAAAAAGAEASEPPAAAATAAAAAAEDEGAEAEEEEEMMSAEELQRAAAQMRAAALPADTALDPAVTEAVGGDAAHARALLSVGIATVLQLADAAAAAVAAALPPPLAAETAEEWVSAAQAAALDALMEELLDDDDELVAVLEEAAKVATPRDLAIMGRNARALVATVRAGVGEGEWAALAARVTAERAAAWHARAVAMLRLRPWLMRWVTE
ncbi:hypothetical protein JKP88DRAFT_325189 [Tribonema minus]|uniref:Ubiquitin-like domain-containing protein n=1 Tax=Tribonema minus TaxID=303371 RepID=A0A835YSU8_9STRA|nr:hypothetical protein JKP88DRAFT_325189 [Tribonema minus]